MSMIETQERVPSQSASSIFSRFLLWLTEPHPKVAEIGDRRRAQLLAGISLILVFPLLFGITLRLFTNDPEDWLSAATLEFVGLVLFSLLAYILSRTQYYQLGSYTLVTAFSMGAIINSFDSGGWQRTASTTRNHRASGNRCGNPFPPTRILSNDYPVVRRNRHRAHNRFVDHYRCSRQELDRT